MKTIETTAVVAPDGQLTVQLQAPPGIGPGEYHIVLVIEEQGAAPEMRALGVKKKRPPLNFPVDDLGPWPDDLSLRREDMYGDDER